MSRSGTLLIWDGSYTDVEINMTFVVPKLEDL